MRKPASAQESLSHCTIWRPSIAAGWIGHRSISGLVEMTMPPGCWDWWRGSPAAMRAELHERPPARRAVRHLGLDVVAGLPRVDRARQALDLPRRQPQRLGEVAHRRAHLVGGEGRHQRRAVVAVALVHARDEHLADVAREVEVDVRQRREVLVEEAAEVQLVGQRVDVREAGEVADDRRHARAPARGPAAGSRAPRRRRAPRRPPRAPARACRDEAGRSPTGRDGGSRAAPRRAGPAPSLARARGGSARRAGRRRPRPACGRRPRSSEPG